MAVKASFGNSTSNQNKNSTNSSNSRNDNGNDTSTFNNNDIFIMHKEDLSPCWSSYWKFLQPQDEMWIVNDNARSHETRRILNRGGSSSPEIHWDPTKDSVVGFCNAKNNRWGVPSALAPPVDSTTTGSSSTPSTSSATNITSNTTQNSSSSSSNNNPNSSGGGDTNRIANCNMTSTTQQSLESSASLGDNDSSGRQDSVLMQPARRESLVLLNPLDMGLFMPERRVSEDSLLTFRTSIGSSTMGTFESILEDVRGDLEDDYEDDDDDDDDDDTHHDNITITTTSTDSNNDTNKDGLVESSSHRFQPNHSYGTNNVYHNTQPRHPDLPLPPVRRVAGNASETNPTNGRPDGARRFAPMIRGTSLPNLDSSRNKGPLVPVRRSSACSTNPAEVRSSNHPMHHGGSHSSSSTTAATRRPSSFEAILEYEPMEDLPSIGQTLSRESSTDDDDDGIDKRWIKAGNGTNGKGNGNAFTLVPMDSLRLSRHTTSPRPATDDVSTTTNTQQQSSSDDDDDDVQQELSSSLLAQNERLCVDEYDRCHSRSSSSYSPKASARHSNNSTTSSSDHSSVAIPTTFLTRVDSVELGLQRRNNNKRHESKKCHGVVHDRTCIDQQPSHSKDDDDNDDGDLLYPPPLVEMDDDSPASLLHTKCTTLMIEEDDKEDDSIPGLYTVAESTPRTTNQSREELQQSEGTQTRIDT